MHPKAFKDLLFFHCYDCGWGEKGVHAAFLTFNEAYRIIEAQSVEAAAQWLRDEDGYFEFSPTSRYMVSEQCFDEADWEGSQDY